MNRRTKIIASIGPASDDEATLKDMIEAGMDVARINLSHGTLEDGLERYRRIRAVAETSGKNVAIICSAASAVQIVPEIAKIARRLNAIRLSG